MDVIDRSYVLISSGSLRFKSVSKKKKPVLVVIKIWSIGTNL